MEWLSIETAPKDGTHILGYCGGSVSEIFWSAPNYADDDDPEIEDMKAWGGFLSDGHYAECRHSIGEPTHWQPLPTPPAQ